MRAVDERGGTTMLAYLNGAQERAEGGIDDAVTASTAVSLIPAPCQMTA
jgi:hypothetical protein